jgi:hypothetical protein
MHRRPVKQKKPDPIPEWVGKYKAHLKHERCERENFNMRVIRLDSEMVALIGNDRRFPLDELNKLSERMDFDE